MPSLSRTAETQGALQRGATGRLKTEMRAKVIDDAAQLFRCLDHEAAALPGIDQRFDFGFESGNLAGCQRHLVLTLRIPNYEAIECLRRYVGREKRERPQPQSASGFHGSAQMAAVATLNGGAGRHREVRIPSMQSSYASGQQIESSWHAPNRIVNFRRAIQRHDHIIQALDDLVRIPLDQESRCSAG